MDVFCAMEADRTVVWTDGSGASLYNVPAGPLVLLWDSDDNPILVDGERAEVADLIWIELTELPASCWDRVWNCILCDYQGGEALTRAELTEVIGS